MKAIAIIPARGGSKGVPKKNIKKLGGKPLIYYTIEAAREIFADDLIIISTDDLEIKQCVEKTGINVPFLRPKDLASDTAGTYEVLIHALNHVEQKGYLPDILILLQPTSPFRTGKHIKEAMKLFTPAIDMVVSVKETKANPYYLLYEEDKQGFLKKSKEGSFIRRQDCPKVWEFNGAIYVINVESLKKAPPSTFKKNIKYVMNEKSSVDIDSPLDFDFAEFLIQNPSNDS